jgi:hypothetical protein
VARLSSSACCDNGNENCEFGKTDNGHDQSDGDDFESKLFGGNIGLYRLAGRCPTRKVEANLGYGVQVVSLTEAGSVTSTEIKK